MNSFPEEQIKAWMKQVRILCHRWRGHPQFDDLLATAYLHMWLYLSRYASEDAGRDHTGLALDGAWVGVHKFLGQHQCITSTKTCRGNPRPEWLSFVDEGDLLLGRNGETYLTPVVPDFAPALIEYLAAREELAKLSPRKRRALIMGCLYGLSRKEIIEETGWSRDVVYKLLASVSGLMTHYGNGTYRP